MRYAVSVGYLGYTRCNNVCVYNPESRGFDDLTPAEARRFIDQKQLKGVLWRNGEEGPEFYPDTEGFNQKDIMIKSANKFRPMLKDVLAGNPVNSFFTVVRVLDTDYRGRLYEVVSNKYSRVKVTEQNLRELNDITVVAGVWITDDEIEVCDGVQYENRKADAEFSRGVYKNGHPVESLPSIKEVLATPDEEPKAEEVKEETPVEGNEEQVVTEEPKEETLDSIFGSVQEQLTEQLAEQTEQQEQAEEAPVGKTTNKGSKRANKKK